MRYRFCVLAAALIASTIIGEAPVAAQGFGVTPAPAAGFSRSGVRYQIPPASTSFTTLPPVEAAPAPQKPKAGAPATSAMHERVVAKNDPRPSVHPASVEMIRAAASRYAAIADAGDWPMMPEGITLRSGASGPDILTLRQRLIMEGDLPREAADHTGFDATLARALKHFQARHGLSETGQVAGATLKALRVSARVRAQQLSASAERLAAQDFAFGGRYVAVNIPSAAVEAVQEGAVARRHVAVVGKPERPSPQVETRILSINLNPTWTVPVSIIKKDIIPKMQKDPRYLAKAKIHIFGASGAEIDPAAFDWKTERATAYTLRQDAGAGNSLGQLRIDMPNREAVYMHDTPSKKLFAQDDRFHSSGCVRVEGVRALALWLLEATPGAWDQTAIDAAIGQEKRKDIRLKEPVPVIWSYLTGYVTPDGVVQFREDVYGLDDKPTLSARNTGR